MAIDRDRDDAAASLPPPPRMRTSAGGDRFHGSLTLLARALEYPEPATATVARQAADRLAGDHIGLARSLWDLAVWLETTPRGEVEERYTGLFDLNPVCTLHVGFQLFGETYQRGEFLAHLSRELREAGVPAGHELADHLPTVLRLLAAVDVEDARILLEDALLPALRRMGEALADSRDCWSALVKALPVCLPEAVAEIPPADAAIPGAIGEDKGVSVHA